MVTQSKKRKKTHRGPESTSENSSPLAQLPLLISPPPGNPPSRVHTLRPGEIIETYNSLPPSFPNPSQFHLGLPFIPALHTQCDFPFPTPAACMHGRTRILRTPSPTETKRKRKQNKTACEAHGRRCDKRRDTLSSSFVRWTT